MRILEEHSSKFKNRKATQIIPVALRPYEVQRNDLKAMAITQDQAPSTQDTASVYNGGPDGEITCCSRLGLLVTSDSAESLSCMKPQLVLPPRTVLLSTNGCYHNNTGRCR